MAAWAPLFEKHDVNLFVVEDAPPWAGIPEFIPRRTDMIRSWGFFRAWQAGAKYTLSLDDDVRPSGDVFAEYERAFNQGWPLSRYVSVGHLVGAEWEMRGFPYAGRGAKAGVQYGGWAGAHDVDAVTQLSSGACKGWFPPVVFPVPLGAPVTTCAMNFAFRTDLTLAMWQLPLFEGRYNRFGDIWSGLVQKKVLDSLGWVTLVNGAASVVHERASDAFKNLEREAPGMAANERVWKELPAVPSGTGLSDGFRRVTGGFEWVMRDDPGYWRHFRACRDEWMGLFR